jgi:hypothetical protein
MKSISFFIIGTRLFLGFVFFGAGMSKLFSGHQFPGLIGPVWLAEKLAEYGLEMYGEFIAWSQAVVGFMLLTQRFATLGAIMLIPMIANILMITISLEWRGTPYVVAFFLFLNMLLLLADFHKLKFLIAPQNEPLKTINIPLNRSFTADAICFAGLVIALCGVPASFLQIYLGYGIVLLGIGLTVWAKLLAKKIDGE